MKTRFFVSALLLISMTALSNPPEEGKSIFLSRCAACHNVNKVMTGPALAGVDQRHSIEWITSFVKSSQTMVKKGDSAAVALFERFNKIPMPDHGDLTAADIQNIVSYIKSEAKTSRDVAPFAKPGALKSFYKPLSLQNYGFIICYILAVIGLAGALYYAVKQKTITANNVAVN